MQVISCVYIFGFILFTKAAKNCGIWLEASCLLAICYAFWLPLYIYTWHSCHLCGPLLRLCFTYPSLWIVECTHKQTDGWMNTHKHYLGTPQKEKTGYFMTSGKIHLKPTHLTRLYYEILVIFEAPTHLHEITTWNKTSTLGIWRPIVFNVFRCIIND